MTPEEDAILDKALYDTYGLRDITEDPATHSNPAPLLSDLHGVLSSMVGAESLARRLTKYTEGTFAGLFNKPTNFELDRGFIVFSIRNLEEALRPLAMYMVLNYIWAQIRFQMRKRLLLVDEAWILMQYPDSARYLYSLAKRARKYYLGLSIISQDVEDFLTSDEGRAILNNSSMQILLKQSPSAVEKLAEVFHLTEGEKFLLLESDVGEGLFFAGSSHVAIKVVASYSEDQIITTDPRQLIEQNAAKQKEAEMAGPAISGDYSTTKETPATPAPVTAPARASTQSAQSQPTQPTQPSVQPLAKPVQTPVASVAGQAQTRPAFPPVAPQAPQVVRAPITQSQPVQPIASTATKPDGQAIPITINKAGGNG
jgi:hypothetical protein